MLRRDALLRSGRTVAARGGEQPGTRERERVGMPHGRLRIASTELVDEMTPVAHAAPQRIEHICDPFERASFGILHQRGGDPRR